MKPILIVLCVILAVIAVFIAVYYILKARALREKKRLSAAPAAGDAAEEGANAKKSAADVFRKYDRSFVLALSYTLLALVCITTVFPFIWMLLTSIKTIEEATNTLHVVFFPAEPQWKNYVDVFEKLQLLTGLKNTMIVEIATIPIGTFVSALVAFAFSKMRLRHKTFWLLFIMSGLMVPYASVLLPQYKIYMMAGLTNTLWPLILPSFFGNVSMAFFFIQFMNGIPNEMFEAARIDGCGYFKSFLLIMIPNMWLAVACQVVFGFVGHWNDFFAPSIYLSSNSPSSTLQVRLYTFAQNADKPLLYAGAFITCIPLFIVYLCFQKCFVGSLAITGIKG